MNTLKLVDIELVKEIRKYDRTLFLVGIAGIIFWKKLRDLEKKNKELRDELNTLCNWHKGLAHDYYGFDDEKERSKED